MSDKKTPIKCESEICCKATAALNKKIEAELEEEDRPLKEIIKDDENTDL
tara:strand:- start:1858 stop:2007 length:150 start_codon:yes stop_codon:yes gene_type:complete